jgi:hypothetical protein
VLDISAIVLLTGHHTIPIFMKSTYFLSINYTNERGAKEKMAMKWGKCKPGSVKIDNEKHRKDIILDRGELHRRKKKPSREFREKFGHTPVSLAEAIPWECKRLVIGTACSATSR